MNLILQVGESFFLLQSYAVGSIMAETLNVGLVAL